MLCKHHSGHCYNKPYHSMFYFSHKLLPSSDLKTRAFVLQANTYSSSVTGFQSLSRLSSYEIIVPKRIEREDQRTNPEYWVDKLLFDVKIEGKPYIIHLKRNRDLVSQDFTIYTYNKNGSLQTETPNLQKHCHYRGYVEGISDSTVAVSTCFGLRGVVQMQDITYGIEPVDSTSRHAIYRMENVKKEPRNCGVSHLDGNRDTTDVQHHLDDSLMSRYYLLGQNKTAVREEMVQLANLLDSMYIMLNIRIVLVGLEIWTFENKIRMEGAAGDVLANFVQWRERDLVPRRRHDSAQLVLRKDFGGTAGMAYVGTVCSKSHAGGINVFGPTSVQAFASIVAHELGHNLGMNHDDDRNCHCETGNCIMNSGASGARNFSACSEEDFEKLTLNKGGSCLLNIPRPEETYSIPYCGNKLVNAGEECDCGSVEECKSDPCCEAGTCRLHSGSSCGYGDCCKDCQYLSKGTVCRERASECDLPEYCNGSSAFCPLDVTIQNGHPCHQDKAYCYDGVCQDYELQCQDIFGPQAKVAPKICFSDVNSKGDRFGNCGYQNREYKKCSSWNAMCGKLQCENVETLPVFRIKPAIIRTPIKDKTCWGVDFQLGSDVPDPGMVNEGTKCAPGKVCKHYQCVNASVLDYDCDITNKCNGRGVCNSNKNCHCNSDWAPPYCDSPGYGGSIDSGPTYNDSNVAARNWILAFVFIVLPIVIVALVLYCTKSKITPSWLPLVDTCCRCFRRSDIGRQQAVRTECPRNFPYSSRNASSSAVVSSMDQQRVPPRPPPPVLKTSRASEQLIPSRPAPLPPI
ncbi:disintegrin and metalloproteinase domain-containing protein 9-like isoform X3 [Ahaetulla prasina]|uniref:disintegrin and metalloproteinase domain-containing protein 9-like isoform X3 n=1 Tax=Ahaetulla prasina TaxID=499056 RepID=UPI002648A2CF|nr:disintegrin and metalloproteinase domain-containing protein 9-like isoform X3 [Ahaetulla prasina]